jgi:hypothetical protein
MKKASLFSVAATSLNEAKVAIESALGIELQCHDSDYRGGDYFRFDAADLELIVQENFVEDDGEPTEARFPSAPFLLYVDGNGLAVDEIAHKLLANKEGPIKELRVDTY